MSSSVLAGFRYALRQIRLAPLFTITVVLGIGANGDPLLYTVMPVASRPRSRQPLPHRNERSAAIE